jgi:hypothetical protein
MRRSIVLGCFALAGCVSAQPGAEKVILTSNAGLVAGCRLIGQETVSAPIMLDVASAQKDATTNLRNLAIKKGGTHVITTGPSGFSYGVGVMQTGDIYRC